MRLPPASATMQPICVKLGDVQIWSMVTAMTRLG